MLLNIQFVVTEQIFISDDTITIRHGFCNENRLSKETSKIVRRIQIIECLFKNVEALINDYNSVPYSA